MHIVTVNDYLARRDSEWMGKVYRFLGLSVGLIVHDMSSAERQQAYAADITYGTNNEMGFDYLRDNMAIYKSQMVQRGHAFAIVDEVDSILIDEARTPLIISGQGDESTDLYRQAENFAARLTCKSYASIDDKEEEDEDLDADYVVDEKARTATLTARGIAKAETAFGLENLADIENATLVHHIDQAIRAHGIMKRDIDYVVKDGEVIIVDEFTGRLMLGRRYSDGLHQAIEAKEHVRVQSENKTLATITFQNYFRLYGKLSGMTGTAMTEEEEFAAIYNLDIIEIPTNKPVIRIDNPDVVYKNEAGKLRAIIEQIRVCHEKGQPVLVGTVSIEKSEQLSKLLRKSGIPHNVLNAKHHEKEAEIVAQAGKFGAVTIATNMAIPRHGHHARRQRGVSGQGGPAQRPASRRRLSPRLPAMPRPRMKRSSRPAPCLPSAWPSIKRALMKRRTACAAAWPVYHRHRAARVPPHRQPAARPLRPSGRPRREPLLHRAHGRRHASVRLRAHAEHDGDAARRRGHAARPQDALQRHRAGPAHGREPQLPGP